MVKDKKEGKKKLKTIKEEPEEENREELSEKLSKAAKDAMRDGDYKKLGKIVDTSEANQVTINANIKSTLKYNK
ncbi:MAG: hypothetical protein U0X86_000310 [Wolbachia endosymbiont of Xenopsylla cheopis]